MNEQLHALDASASRLRSVVERLAPEQLTGRAYPAKWTIADVLSHLGSSAVIYVATLDATAGGGTLPDGFNQSIWDEWNSKRPVDQATEALTADRRLLDRIAALTDAQRGAFHLSMGPLSLDLPTYLGMRLNEHTLHTWDIEVALDASATLPIEETNLVVDNLEIVGRYGGKPDGSEREVRVHTVEPRRDFAIIVTPEAVSLAPTTAAAEPDLVLPAEAFIRLVYGRLDQGHTPRGLESAELDSLRSIYRGV